MDASLFFNVADPHPGHPTVPQGEKQISIRLHLFLSSVTNKRIVHVSDLAQTVHQTVQPNGKFLAL